MMTWAGCTSWEVPLGLDTEVDGLRRGDPDAVTALVMRYQHRLYRYLVRIVHDAALAEDLFQQTWVRVVENSRRYDPRRSFEPWLFSVARNLAFDHLRRYRPESLDEPLASGEPRAERFRGAGPGALEQYLAHERVALVGRALESLAPYYREVLTLRFEEEMKLEEIAEVLALPLSTVKTRLRRALEGLRARLEPGLAGGAV